MGSYTCLRVTVVIKKQYHGVVKALVAGSSWSEIKEQYPDLYSCLKEWNNDRIPFGESAYLPDTKDWNHGENMNTYCEESATWTFICSFKNYEKELQSFCTTVLSEIIEEDTSSSSSLSRQEIVSFLADTGLQLCHSLNPYTERVDYGDY